MRSNQKTVGIETGNQGFNRTTKHNHSFLPRPLFISLSNSLLLQEGGFEACSPITSFGCLLNKPFPCFIIDISVNGFSVSREDKLGLNYGIAAVSQANSLLPGLIFNRSRKPTLSCELSSLFKIFPMNSNFYKHCVGQTQYLL